MQRIGTGVVSIAALLLFLNGAWMLIDPGGWFAATPIVWRTGIPNLHFTRDVGWTYAAIGLLLAFGLVKPQWRTPSVILSLYWLLGHFAIHAGETAVGLCGPAQFVAELPQVLGPCLMLALALGLDALARRERAP